MNFFKDHNHKRLFQLLLLSVLALFLSLLSNQAVMATAEGYCIGENCIYSWWGTGTIGYLPRWTGAQVFGNSVIYQSGTNIGIGTTSPQGGFHINTATGRQIVAGNWVDVSGADGGYGLLGGNMYLNKSPTAFKYSVTHASIGAMGFVVNYPWNTASIITSGTTSSTAGVEFTPVSIATFRYDGNVGIGTTSPAQKLHVAGYARADSGFCIGTSCITAWPQGEVTGSGTTNYIPLWTTSSNIGNSAIYQSGTNIGIGTTTPGAKLDVSGGLNLRDRLYTFKDNVRTFENVAQYYGGSAPTTGTVVVTIGNTVNMMLEGEIVIQGYGTLTKCHFRGYTYTGSTTWHMPAATCLSSQASGGYTVRFGKRASDNARVILIGTTSSNWGSYPHISVTRVTYGYPGSGSSIGDWSISIVTDESAYTSLSSVNVNSGFKAYNPVFDGNVGIGTTSPAQKLHVAGYARADSGFCIGTSCITAWPQGEVTGSGTANYIPRWTTSSNIGNSVIYQSGTNIGIGTTSPTQQLQLSGNIKANSAEFGNGIRIGSGFGSGGTQTIHVYNNDLFLQYNNNQTDAYVNIGGQGTSGNLRMRNSANVDNILISSTGNSWFNAGNVGIGTTSPAQKLHVAGYARADSGFCIGTSCITAWPQGEVTGSGTANYVPLWTTSSNIGNSAIYQSGSRIGIGTTSPSQLLTVQGTDSDLIKVISSSDVGASISLESTGLNGSTWSIISTANEAWGGGGNLGFINNSFRLYVKADGNVGIGTTSPAQKLHVAGYARADSGFCIGTSCITAWPQGGVTGSGTTNYVPLWTTSSNIGNSVIYQSGSNIGIGTTSPGSTLDVAGNININEGSAYLYDGVQGLKLAKGEDTFYANTSIGDGAGNSTATRQTAVGYQAGDSIEAYWGEIGYYQAAVGYYAGNTNSGNYQTALGAEAGNANSGNDQTAVGYYAGRLNTGDRQTALGVYAGWVNTGDRQTAVGYDAGNSNIGNYQTAVGYAAGYSNTGIYQTALGYYTGYSNTGTHQTAVSSYAGYLNSGDYQTAVGHYAGRSNTGFAQTAVGHQAGYFNTGTRQVALGNHAGNGNTGIEQIALGYYAGYSNTGNYQTAVGHFAGNSNTGTHQTALGYYAGYYNSGHRVTGVGYEATRDNTANDVVAIGYQAGMDNAVANQFIIKQANINATPLIQGDFLSGNVGIGTTSPQEKLDVNGNVRANEYYYSSDISLKTGIGYLPGEETLSKVLKLQGVSFKWKESGKSSIGFIAQDVEKIFPELVNTDQNGLKSIQYGNLIAPLVESIKEQQKQIEQLRQEIEELKR